MEVHVSLIGRRDLAGEIYRQLAQAIRAGRLRPGERLPPTRELAQRLSVSRTTVSVAYDRLVSEGFLTSRVGAGTFVSAEAARVPVPARLMQATLRPRPSWCEVPVQDVRDLFRTPFEFDFRPGVPDAGGFPLDVWRRLVARELHASAAGIGVYGDPSGHAGLRAAIASHIGVSRGVYALPEDVTVTGGTQQALDAIARVLVAPGERVAIEGPGYPPAWRLFRALGLEVAAVPVDGEGLVVDALPADARIVYVSPSHQFPLGVSMSLRRRMALLAWAQRHDAAIVEDDYDSEFRYEGRPIEPLRALDGSGRVIYVGSFSKTALPTLRLGFVVTPPSLSEALAMAKHVMDWHTPLTTQAAMARFIDEGRFARHIRRMRGVYRVRHQRIVAGLGRDLGGGLEVVPSAVGLHICALAPGRSVEQVREVVARAAAAGVAVHALDRYAVGGTPRAGLVLGYGAIPPERVDEGLRRLRRAFER